MLNRRTGVDVVTLAVLASLEEMDATPAGFYKKSATVLEHVNATRGIAPRYGYDAMVTGCADWLTHVRLVDFHGNHGSPDPNDNAAAPRYTECRLSPAGAMALASERGDLPRLPIALINGDLAPGGSSPPFDPWRVADAVLAAGSDVDDAALVAMVGPPAFPTGCDIEVDLAALASGEPTTLRMSARCDLEETARLVGGEAVVLSHLPFGIGSVVVTDSIARRVDTARNARNRPELRVELDLPIRDVRDETTQPGARIVCLLNAGADPDDCRARLLDIWPVATERTVRLRAPLAQLLRDAADDPVVQAPALAELLNRGPLRRR